MGAEEKLKILIFAVNRARRYNRGMHLFLQELARQHDVRFYGVGWDSFRSAWHTLDAVLDKLMFQPDLILVQGKRGLMRVHSLRDYKKIPKIFYMIDYFPRNAREQNFFIKDNGFDMVMVPYHHSLDRLMKPAKRIAEHLIWMPFSVDTSVYKKLDLNKMWDIAAMFSVRPPVEYPMRRRVIKIIQKEFAGRPVLTIRVILRAYVRAINKAKICMQNTDAHGSFNMRMTEIPACGTFLMSDQPDRRDLEGMGFIPNRHFGLYSGAHNMVERIDYYLKNEEEREEIAKCGYKFVRARHNNSVRAKEFTDVIRKAFKPHSYEEESHSSLHNPHAHQGLGVF